MTAPELLTRGSAHVEFLTAPSTLRDGRISLSSLVGREIWLQHPSFYSISHHSVFSTLLSVLLAYPVQLCT